jgi:two-component system, NtrC family, nitrogen regulation response regulator NtrX
MPTPLYICCPESARDELELAVAPTNLPVHWSNGSRPADSLPPEPEPLVLLDLDCDNALAMMKELRRHRPSALVVVVAHPDRARHVADIVSAGADVVSRPVSSRRLCYLINSLQASAPGAADLTLDEAERDKERPSGVFGPSEAMQEVREKVRRAAAARSGVLIVGEPGSGREMVARAIHTCSPRPNGPFVAADCARPAAADCGLELFGMPVAEPAPGVGHEDGGSWPRESLARGGAIYRALGGTLFLTGLAEMPPHVQSALTRVLRERTAVMPDGPPLRVDVRVAASVDPAIDLAVDQGRVKPELFKRLSVHRIDVPPLRARRDDVPVLASHFAAAACDRLGITERPLSDGALALLGALPWDGNADELQALIEQLASIPGDGPIDVSNVLSLVRLNGGRPAETMATGTLRDARRRFEREFISAALNQHRWRIPQAARSLGMQRTNLYRKIRSLRIGKPPREPKRA